MLRENADIRIATRPTSYRPNKHGDVVCKRSDYGTRWIVASKTQETVYAFVIFYKI